MSYGEPVCVFCGDAVETRVGGDVNGLKQESTSETLGRVCEVCIDDVLGGVPEGPSCVHCDADAEYVHVPLTLKRTAEGKVPYLTRDGTVTPVLCADHVGDLVT